jgi:hypothetical protein
VAEAAEGAHNGAMAKRGAAKPFAEMVRDLVDTPTPEPAKTLRRIDLSHGQFLGPGGVVWLREADTLRASEALSAIQEGALVAWDSCGCGGDCGFIWPDTASLQRMAKTAPKVRDTKRHFGRLTGWRSADGRYLVVASGEVRWGQELS